MADNIRSAKSGSDWSMNELIAYNITIRCQSSETFFGYTPNTTYDALDPALLTATVPPRGNFLDSTRRYLVSLDLATNTDRHQESAIDDFAKDLLCTLGFEEQGTGIRLHYATPFMISGDSRRFAKVDLCLLQGETTILLIIEEDKTIISAKNPEPQVIAEAIAAFQHNNNVRKKAGLPLLDTMTIPAITMIGTCPTFYKIPITQELNNAVVTGQYPVSQTEVLKCVVAPSSCHPGEGMEVPDFRREVVMHYEAFRKMAKDCWEKFII